MSNWYYAQNGQQKGPISGDELRTLATQGQLRPDDLVWCEGMPQWQPARELANIAWPTQQPPPISAMRQVPSTCPLCGGAKHMDDARLLYNHFVCRKCYYAFTNRRQFAYVIDAVVINLLCLVPMVNLAVLLLCAGKDCFAGQSLGKALCGVRVIDRATGKAGGFGMSFKRNLPLYIPFMPLVIGFGLSKGFRLGDGWAHSKVIWNKYKDHPVFAADKVVA